MSQIANQEHGKFKVFAGKLDANNGLGDLADKVSAFASENKIAAKSIGVEYLESAESLIITLGYRDDEDHYPIKLETVALGKMTDLGQDFSALEQKMEEASSNVGNIICHELYVTDDKDFLMVFMTHQ
ncbi:MAG: hypothetical protein K1X72_27570 [Pyrinomonadaceae bacterium]|nr:hypothetical protein [Pyrinomonadaceae bacterium]